MISLIPVIGMFCDDIRREQNGQDTLIGVYPDSISVSTTPGFLPRLCIYVRFHFPTSESRPKTISVRIVRPDVEEHVLNIEDEVITKAFSELTVATHPYVGVIARAVMTPFPINNLGRINVVALVDGREQICASLLVKAVDANSTS